MQASYAVKLRDQLTFLNTAMTINDMDIPGWRFHPLKGRKKISWSITVSKNRRVVFKFEDGHASIVNYEDYR